MYTHHKLEQASVCWLINTDICHVDKFARRWRIIVLVFFHVQPVYVSYGSQLYVWIEMTLWPSPNDSDVKSKPSVRQNDFSLQRCLWNVHKSYWPPCCAQSTGRRTLKYLRLFWFSLLQECTACVTHRQPQKWSMSSISRDHHKITFFEDEKNTDLF